MAQSSSSSPSRNMNRNHHVGTTHTTTTTTSSNSTTNVYITTLARELATVCRQHSTSTGDLSTGGLGVWTWLQYQSSFHWGVGGGGTDGNGGGGEGRQRRLLQLQAARDAAKEALKGMTNLNNNDEDGRMGGNSDDSFFDDMEDDFEGWDGGVSPLPSEQLNPNINCFSMSMYTNPYLACHAMLAVILYQLGEDATKVQYHVKCVLRYIRQHCRNIILTQQQQQHQQQQSYLFYPPGIAGDESHCDVWSGRAGAMQTIFFLRQHLQQETLGQGLVITLARQILSEGRRVAQRVHQESVAIRHNDPIIIDYDVANIDGSNPSNHHHTHHNSASLPLLWVYQGTVYLGCIHGVVGICNALLGLSNDEWDLIEQHSAACEYTQRYSLNQRRNSSDELHALANARQLVKQTIDGLERYCFVSGNLRKTLHGVLLEVDNNDHGWAHGAGGYVLLLLRSHEVFGGAGTATATDVEGSGYLRHARQLAEQILWARRLVLTQRGGGIGLTTGIAGVAYVFVRLAQVLIRTSNGKEALLWKQRAEQLARHGVNHWRELLLMSSNTSHPYSVMEGLGGLVSLLLDLNCIKQAQFPFMYQPGTVTSSTINLWRTKQQQQPPQPVSFSYGQVYRQPQESSEEPRKGLNQNQRIIRQPRKDIARTITKAATIPISKIPKPTTGDSSIAKIEKREKDDVEVTSGGFERLSERGSGKTVGRHVLIQDSKETILFDGSDLLDGEENHDTAIAMVSDRGNEEPDFKEQGEDSDPDAFKVQDSDNVTFDVDVRGRPKNAPQWVEEQHRKVEGGGTNAKKSDEGIQEYQNLPQNDQAEDQYQHGESAATNLPLSDAGSPKILRSTMIANDYTDGMPEFENPGQIELSDEKFDHGQDSDIEISADGQVGVIANSPVGVITNSPIIDRNEQRATPLSKTGSMSVPRSIDTKEDANATEQEEPVGPHTGVQVASNDLYSGYGTSENRRTSGFGAKSLQKDEEQGRQMDLKETLADEQFDVHFHSTKSNLGRKSSASVDAIANDGDEFQLPGDQDKPNRLYMRRQDSADEEYFAYASAVKQNPFLDEEEHSGHLNSLFATDAFDDLIRAENEAEEFQAAASGDQPDKEYLRMQGSSDDLTMSAANGHNATRVSLDEDVHTNIGMDLLMQPSGWEEYADDFEETNETDEPDKRYLSKQDSEHDLYYEYYTDQENLAVAKAEMRHLVNQAAAVAAGSILRSPKRRGKKTDIAKKTPPRYPRNNQQGITTPATAATTTMTGTPQSINRTINSSGTTQLNLALVEECLKEAEGEGNILNGGIGVSVFLRIKLSEYETDAIKSNELLQAALKYALTAVEDAMAEPNGRTYPSILSSDLIGSQCLLVSLLYRLGRRKDARRLANATIAKLAELHEVDTKKDCSAIFGLAGALQAIWFLRKELDDEMFGRDYAVTASTAILIEGLKQQGNYQTDALLMWEWHERPFLGAGIGATGILYSLLGLSDEEWINLNGCLPRAKQVIRQTIDSLGNLTHPSGNLMAAIDGFDEDRSTDWTHGAPGYCLLLLRAFEVFDDDRYFTQAQEIAENVIWPRRMQRRGLGLARGVSGVAYVFMALARVDIANSELWRLRAAKMADMAITDLEELKAMSKHPNSLFEGLGGLVSLLIDLERPTSDVYFPFFEHQIVNKDKKSQGLLSTFPDIVGGDGNDQRYDDGFADGSNQSNLRLIGTPKGNENRMSPRRNDRPSNNNNTKSHFSNSGGQAGNAGNETFTTTTAPTSTGSNAASINLQYVTPPRAALSLEGARTTTHAVSPMTEPSPGYIPARPRKTGVANRYVQTNRQKHSSKETQTQENDLLSNTPKKRLRHYKHQVKRLLNTSTSGGHSVRQKYSPKVWPPQIKRHIHTHPDDVPLAKQATISWKAKIQTQADNDAYHHSHSDTFTTDSIERKQRAELSWFKRKSMLLHKYDYSGVGATAAAAARRGGLDGYLGGDTSAGASVGSNGSSSFRRLVGGFEGC